MITQETTCDPRPLGELLRVKDLKTEFKIEAGIVHALNGVSYTVNEREIIGIVGESGCGKSVSQLSVIQLIRKPGRIVSGEVWFEGKNLLEYDAKGAEMRAIRGAKIGMIFQEPMTSLNPVFTVGDQIAEGIRLHQGLSKRDSWGKAVEMLRLVRIPDPERQKVVETALAKPETRGAFAFENKWFDQLNSRP